MSTVAVVECWSCGGLDESTAAATGGDTGHTGHSAGHTFYGEGFRLLPGPE